MDNEKPKIVCLPNGPYYLLNDMEPRVVPNIQTSSGGPCSTITGVALCRCGASNNKPFCDGSHGSIGFSDEKLSDRAPDKRTDYVGSQITIHDNRALCAHAGHCTENLKNVFKYGKEPWIDPEGASVDDIIYTIEQCPSGALSYSINNIEHRNYERQAMVTVTKDGPYAITGGIELLNQPMGAGASAEHYTLCRCGASKNKPFCDGSHWSIEFKDEIN
jgi:CDGSH-type Zn-finger protein